MLSLYYEFENERRPNNSVATGGIGILASALLQNASSTSNNAFNFDEEKLNEIFNRTATENNSKKRKNNNRTGGRNRKNRTSK